MSTVCWGCCQNQQHYWIFDFHKVVYQKHCRWGGNLCDVYIQNFLMNLLVKVFWKSVHICQSNYQRSSGMLFSRHSVYTVNKYCKQCKKQTDVNKLLSDRRPLMQTTFWEMSSPHWQQLHQTVDVRWLASITWYHSQYHWMLELHSHKQLFSK